MKYKPIKLKTYTYMCKAEIESATEYINSDDKIILELSERNDELEIELMVMKERYDVNFDEINSFTEGYFKLKKLTIGMLELLKDLDTIYRMDENETIPIVSVRKMIEKVKADLSIDEVLK